MPSQETSTTLGWSIPVTALLTATVSIIGTLYAVKGGMSNAPNAPPGIGSVVKDTISYLPHILLLFGVIADMLTYEGVYYIPGLIGLFSIPINFLFAYFWSGILDVFTNVTTIISGKPFNTNPILNSRADKTTIVVGAGRPGDFSGNYDGCEVQGFGKLRNPYAPQTLVITATIFFYYVLDLIANRGWVNSTATILMFFVLYTAQVFVVGDCPNEIEISKFVKAAIAAFEGLFIGGVSYAVVQAKYPSHLPSSVISPFPRKSKDDLKPGTNSTNFVDDNGNPYICLPGGQCYPDMSTQESRTAFAKIASDNLGTGSAPAADCSAK